jgi:hypothetical protein
MFVNDPNVLTFGIQAIYAIISPDIKPNPNEPGAYGIPCHLISSIPAQIDITFTSQQGVPFNLTIPSDELNVGPFASDPMICQTRINALDGLYLVEVVFSNNIIVYGTSVPNALGLLSQSLS